MILLTGLDSIVESLYLKIPITDKFKDSTIIVNPDSITYLSKKTIIISKLNYSLDNINMLLSNGNTIISRIFINDSIKFIPYLPRICDKIMWCGRYVTEELNEENFSSVHHFYDGDKLYYPKSNSYGNVMDNKKNLSVLGYLLYQIGENLYDNTPFLDLDVVKLGKGLFP